MEGKTFFNKRIGTVGQSVLEMAKDLVMAQIQAGVLSPEDMHEALKQTYTNLMALKVEEDKGLLRPLGETVPGKAWLPWKKSIGKHTITCLECGAILKQLSGRHLRTHGLDVRSYRAKYGIPRVQPLSAKDTTTMRKKIVQQTRPWEKAPTYLKAHGAKTAKGTAPKSRRKKQATTA